MVDSFVDCVVNDGGACGIRFSKQENKLSNCFTRESDEKCINSGRSNGQW